MTTANTSPGTHPNVGDALEQLRRFNSALEAQMQRTATGSFSASDETETVEVTINGHRCLTGLHIEDGLLRLGAETVEQRINEALGRAQAVASQASLAQQADLVASLSEVATSLTEMVKDYPTGQM
jgi:DNA-binding protein YbaB